MTRRMTVIFVVIGLLLICPISLSIFCINPTVPEVSIGEVFTYSGIVPIRTEYGAGSGFVIRDEGESYLIVTAAHVVDMETTMLILGIEAEVVAIDYETDIAILRMPRFGREWKVWPLADAEIEGKCRIAGFVYVNGIDRPLFAIYWGRVTTVNWRGCISFNGGAFPGLSGSPLINEKGFVTAVLSGCAGAWGHPMETATILSPIENIEALLEGVDNGIAITQPI